MIAKSVKHAVDSVSVTRPEFEKVKSNVRLLKYETDRLDQSSRKDNFRIHNLVKSDGEVTITDSVVNLMNAILSPEESGTSIPLVSERDISLCHFVGKPSVPGGKRQILVRVLSRQLIHSLFQNKKKLKNIDKYKDVFLTEDLTPLRLKLKAVVKGVHGTSNVHSKDGTIHCSKNNQHFMINNPDDLFALGVDVDLNELGLMQYV